MVDYRGVAVNLVDDNGQQVNYEASNFMCVSAFAPAQTLVLLEQIWQV